MRKKVVLLGFVSVLLLSVVLPQIGMTSPSAYNKFGSSAPSIQLGLTIDGSGSISASNFAAIKNGVAAAVRNNMPHNETVELIVVQFGTYDATGARVEVSPTVINETNYDAVATAIESISQGGDFTPTADGLYLTWVTMNGSTNFETATTQVINIVTDGVPNKNLTTISSPTGDPHNDATWVRDMAAGQGLDKLDSEGIGVEIACDLEWMQDHLVYPQPGAIAPPYTRDTGWVKWVATAEEFAEEFCQKFIFLFPPEHELAVTLDFRTSGLGATVHNYGSSNEADVEVQFLINGTEKYSTTITELLTDSSYTLSYLWIPTVEGTYNVTAYAPPVPDEDFTANNVACSIVQFEPGHDVAVVNVVPSKTVVGQGYCLYIKVTVKNKGAFTETFHVFLYHDELVFPTPEQWETFWSMGDVNRDGYIDQDDVDIIEENWLWQGPPGENPADINSDGIVNVDDLVILSYNFGLDIWTCLGLSPPTGGQQVSGLVGYGTSTTITFTWNTTGVPYGDYPIRAYALLGLYDENCTNNNYVDGTVKVTIPADATGDGYVNLDDIEAMSAAWLTENGHPDYNANVDFTCDGMINLDDIEIMSDYWLHEI